MTRIRIELLGATGFIDGAGARQNLPSRNSAALLALLAVARGRIQQRTRLATLLWDGVDIDHARASLRQTLFVMRRVLGEAPIVSDGETLKLAAAVDVDLWEFADLVARGTPEALQRAGELYQGDLLEGHAGGRSFAFDEWLAAEQQRLRGEVLHVLACVLDHAVLHREPATARRAAARMLAIDPAEETAHRALMRIYAGERRFGLALRQYEWCRKVLFADLGIEPDEETRRLHAEILRSRARSAPPVAIRPVGGIGLQLAGA